MVSSLALSARAVTIDEMKRTLSELRGTTPIVATIDVSEENSGQGRTRTNRGHAEVEERNGAVRFNYATDSLSRAAARDALSEDPGFASIDEVDAYEFLNFAPELLRDLSYATIVRQAPTTWQGKAATLVELKLTPPAGAVAQKYVKSSQTSLTLYIGADGFPLASSRNAQVKGRIVLIPFQASNKQSAQFQRVGDRLVVVRNERQGTASGFGQEGTNKTVTTLTPRNGS